MAYWFFSAESRVTHANVVDIEQRLCPRCEAGYLNRLAERNKFPPYRWVPIGYRCDSCGQAVIETKVEV